MNIGPLIKRSLATVMVLGLTTALTTGPAAAATLPTMSERETWTTEEHRAYGQDLFDDVDSDMEAIPTESAASTTVNAVPGDITTDQPATTTTGESLHEVKPGRAVLDVGGQTAGHGTAGILSVTAAASAGVDGVEIRVLDSSRAEAAGVEGVLVTARSVGSGGTADLSVDISGVEGPADWAARARLVKLPACVLTTPQEARCQTQSPLAVESAVNTDGVVSGTVELDDSGARLRTSGSADSIERSAASSMTVLAVAADGDGAEGDWTATSLDPSSTWSAGGNTGAFTWSYPMRTPATPGGLDPEVSLNYDSGSLDGRVASTNSQAGAIGDGWDLSVGGFIERAYVPCSQDQKAKDGEAPNNSTHDTGDLCWKSDNATLSLGGQASELIQESADVFRLKDDDNTLVERLHGGWNADNDDEYWKVTTADGTQYWFGRDGSGGDRVETKSGNTVPVYGNHPGEPCYASTFKDSRCQQAWRWNLDYVVDPSGNSMTYVYARETNRYEPNNGAGDGTSAYNMGGPLRYILYGTRQGSESETPPARVVFSNAQRCLPTETFNCDPTKAKDNPNKWPDVPVDLECSSSTSCVGQYSPTFFSRKMYTAVTTQIRESGAWKTVDKWNLKHSFPDPGGLTGKQLWLDQVTHKGVAADDAGDDVTLPAVKFTGTAMPNRVDTPSDGASSMSRFRLARVTSEAGGVTDITYSTPDCGPNDQPAKTKAAAASNTRRCQPVYWTPWGSEEPTMEWFHKYVVTHVSEDPRQGAAEVETSYSYGGGAAWHYNDDEMTRPKQRTWNQWRGYERVDTTVGDPGDSASPQLKTRTRYFRGMHGDKTAAGGTRTVDVDGITDHEHFAGMTREEITYDGTKVVDRELSTPWRSAATASDGGKTARHTGVQKTRTVTTTPDLAGGTRTSQVDTEFDSYGMPIAVTDRGDTATAGDETCTRTTYIRNEAKNILETVRRTETVAKRCDQTVSRPADVLADERYAYDGGAIGAPPTKGLVTKTQEVDGYADGSGQYITTSTSQYDKFGRTTSQSDALGHTTTTAYTDNAQGLNTRVVTTSADPDGSGPLTAHETTTVLDPAFAVPKSITDAAGNTTTGRYDGLGRLTGVWEPDRVQGTDTPSTAFTYTVRDSGVNAVTTSTLNWDASERIESVTLLDGLLRQRQTQAPSADKGSPGRVVADMLYDSRGLDYLTTNPWYTTGDPAAGIVTPVDDTAVPGSTVTRYDGAGRSVEQIHRAGSVERWSTTTEYRGDRVLVDPPAGGTPTMTISDVRGQTIELRQYTGSAPTGDFQTTTYQWDLAGRMTGAADDAGNQWSYEFDLRGREVSSTDPDKGTVTSTYDDAGQVTSMTDARGKQLAFTYDALGRKVAQADATSGQTLASWAYDTVAKGQLTSSTRHGSGGDWVQAVTGYDDHGRPTGREVTVPSTSDTAAVAGDYEFGYTYTQDGRPLDYTLPGFGTLGPETVSTFYDSANQAEWMVAGRPNVWGTYVYGSTYSPYGELLQAGLGSGWLTDVRWSYEADTRRLTRARVQHEGADGLDIDARYNYDPAGNVLGVDNTPTRSGVEADRQCFDYDGLRRLTSAWTPADGDCEAAPDTGLLGGADPYWTDYSYDAVGNRTGTVQHVTSSASGGTAGNASSTYSYPAAGGALPHAVSQVTTTDNAGTSLGASTYTYDAAGNMTGRDLAGQAPQTLQWDIEGELASVEQDEDGDGSITGQERDAYVYDADGNRLARTQDGFTTVYLPGGMEITGPVTGQQGSATAVRYYQFAGKTVSVRTAGGAGGTTTVVPDHHNTGVWQYDQSAGSTTRRYTDPFGATRGALVGDQDANGRLDSNTATASWTGDHSFLDKPADSTGLTAIGARMYDPTLGKFISVDPVMDLADPQQWNAYTYANGSPVTMSDPTGERPFGASHLGGTNAKHGETKKQRKNSYDRMNKPRKPKPKPELDDGGNDSWYTPGYTPAVNTSGGDSGSGGGNASGSGGGSGGREKIETTPLSLDAIGDGLSDAWSATRDWAQNDDDWWGGQNASLWLGIGAAVIGLVGIALTATGVGAPAGLALTGLALGVAATAIDCTAEVDASCALGVAGVAVGGGSLKAASKAKSLGWKPQIPSQNSAAADNWANGGVTLDMASASAGIVGAGASGISRGTGWNW